MGVENFHERASDSHQLGGPQRCVEEDVVLADEVELLRVGIRPPLAPRIRVSICRFAATRPSELRPLNRRGEVADDGLKPHVEFFRFPTRLTDRDGDAPIQVACDGARFESLGFDLPQRFAEDGVAHVVGAFLEELLDFGFEFGEVNEVVLGVAQFECAVACLGAWIN